MKYLIKSLPFLAWLLLLNDLPYIGHSYTLYMDRWNWCFVVLAIISAVCTRVAFKRAFEINVNYRFVLMYLGVAIIYVMGELYDINMITLIAKILVPFVTIALIYGWSTAAKFLPTWGLLFLALPNVNYTITTYFSINGLAVQIALGAILAMLNGVIIYSKRSLSPKAFIFAVGVLVVVGGSLIGRGQVQYEQLNITLIDMSIGDYIVKEKTLSGANEMFFANMHAEEVAIANDDAVINMLKVSDLSDIHKIHPASHCLRTAKQRVLSDSFIKVNINGQDYEFNEIAVQNLNQSKRLIWAWYSNDTFSTANYLYFRKCYYKYDNWSTYQLVVASDGSLDESRQKLKSFLEAYLKVL